MFFRLVLVSKGSFRSFILSRSWLVFCFFEVVVVEFLFIFRYLLFLSFFVVRRRIVFLCF